MVWFRVSGHALILGTQDVFRHMQSASNIHDTQRRMLQIRRRTRRCLARAHAGGGSAIDVHITGLRSSSRGAFSSIIDVD